MTSRSAPGYPDDPDVEHLLRLLAVLPGRENVAFWNSFYPSGPRSDAESADLDPKAVLDGYVLEKMTVGIRNALGLFRDWPPDYGYLARYVMMFFRDDSPRMFDALDAVVPGEGNGHRFAQELRETAWHVAVRYDPDYKNGPEEVLAKWPDPRA
jgi:hypothetical protein